MTESLTDNNDESHPEMPADNNSRQEMPARRRELRDAAGARLSTNNLNFGIPTNMDAHDHVNEYHGTESWRSKLLHFIHKDWVQKSLMALLCLDVLILFTELLLLAQFPHCAIVERDAISCCPLISSSSNLTTNDGGDEQHLLRWLAGGDEDKDDLHGGDICEDHDSAPNYDFMAGCDSHKWQKVHTGETVLFGLTITILSIFLVELHCEMIALGPCIFFRQVFYALDFIIVTVSITLELIFHFADQDTLQSLIGLIVVARIWRFIRIGHGIIEVTSEVTHNQYEKLMVYTEQLEKLLDEHSIDRPDGKGIKRKHSSAEELATKH